LTVDGNRMDDAMSAGVRGATQAAAALVQAMSVFGASASLDEDVFKRTHETQRTWDVLADQRAFA
jgi:hypothetical protein